MKEYKRNNIKCNFIGVPAHMFREVKKVNSQLKEKLVQ